jgi:hypothetical protein
MPKISRKKKTVKKSRAPISTRRGSCKYGYIRRKGYVATKKSGKKVRVKASCIKERGRKGPGRSGSIKRRVIKISKPGSLKDLGYHLRDTTTQRDAALKKILKKYGYSSSIKKLNAIAVLMKNTEPGYHRKLQRDMGYIRKLANRSK